MTVKITISGIRGVFGEDLTLKEILGFSNNFVPLIKSKKCVLARDTRPSGKMITKVVSAALRQCGMDVYDLGMVPTPVAFREARKFGAGIIVTSSHNPIQWNGLKMIVNGRGINNDELEIIKKKQNTEKKSIGSQEEISSEYIKEAIQMVGQVQGNPKIILDIGAGAAVNIAPKFLEQIGCKVTTINEKLESNSRGPDPTTDELIDLCKKSKDYEIGFAYDLDGDRLVIVKDGKKQIPDLTLGLGVAKSIELGHKKFVLSLDTSIAIEKYIIEKGGIVTRSKVGEANVIDTMLKTNSHVGGEGSSGGFIISDFNNCRDGILTSGMIASMLNSKSFDDIINKMNKFTQIRDKISVDSEFHEKIIDSMKKIMKEQFGNVETIDGVKSNIDEDSWVLIRKSNTEDIIRISVESSNKENAQNILNEIKEIINNSYEKIR